MLLIKYAKMRNTSRCKWSRWRSYGDSSMTHSGLASFAYRKKSAGPENSSESERIFVHQAAMRERSRKSIIGNKYKPSEAISPFSRVVSINRPSQKRSGNLSNSIFRLFITRKAQFLLCASHLRLCVWVQRPFWQSEGGKACERDENSLREAFVRLHRDDVDAM